MNMLRTKEEVIATILNEKNVLLVQDLDGVCIPLVQDPLKRELKSEYVLAASTLRNNFSVLTCGEHEGRRGVNRLVEKALLSPPVGSRNTPPKEALENPLNGATAVSE